MFRPFPALRPAGRGVTPIQTPFHELAGMFSHAAGTVQDERGQPLLTWAWGHEQSIPGCSDLYFWDLTAPSQSPLYFERFWPNEADGWLYLVGWSVPSGEFLSIQTPNGAGQRYARLRPTQAYTVACEDAGLYLGDVCIGRYADVMIWAPVDGGWAQHEVFRWLTPMENCAFGSYAELRPRALFSTAGQSFITDAGVITHRDNLRTALTWSW